MRVAIIGAGVAGLSCALELEHHGVESILFDKGHRIGGRFSTKRVGGAQFDHGAQFFRARGASLRAATARWRADGLVAAWAPRLRGGDTGAAPRDVGFESNRSLPEAIAARASLRVQLATRVALVERAGGRLHLRSENGAALGDFDRVVITAPAPQAEALLGGGDELAALRTIQYAPCWTLLVDFTEPLPVDFDALREPDPAAPVAWAAREASKPGRPAGHAWTVQASPAWSRAHLDESPEEVATKLTAALPPALGLPALPPRRTQLARRWRYALVERPLGALVFSAAPDLLVAGDGLLGGRVEAAWDSGLAAALRLLGSR